MSLLLQGVLVSASLVGVGVYFFWLIPSRRSDAKMTTSQMRQAGFLGILFGAVMAGFTVYLFLRGTR
jgi:hypothetical protein